MLIDFIPRTLSISSRWRPSVLILLTLVGVSPSQSAERRFLSPNEMSRLGVEEAWQRQLSLPAGASSLVDQKLFVHGVAPKQYVEVVAKQSSQPAPNNVKAEVPADGEATSSETPPEPTLYARYLLHPEAEAEANGTNLRDEPTRESLLDNRQSSLLVRARQNYSLLAAKLKRADFHSGGMLDRVEAERLAKNEIRRLKRRGIEAEMRDRTVPRVRLYTLGNDGTVECRDAETGELVWLRRVGYRQEGFSGLAADDMFVTVLNGGRLIKLDVNNGEEISIQELRYVPTGAAIHCGEYALVPSIGDRVVCYPLVNLRRDVFSEIVSGGALGLPTNLLDSEKAAWGTSEGFVYLIEASGEPNVQFRLNSDGIVSGQPAAAPGERFFFGTDTGQIYGLKATRSGVVLWSWPTGDPIYDSPLFADERLVFRSAYGNLFCIDAETGLHLWDQPVRSIGKIVGRLGDAVYLQTLAGGLMVVSLSDGSTIGQFAGVKPSVFAINTQTDRFYFVSDGGAVQCIRKVGADMPTLVVAKQLETATDEAESAETEKKDEKRAPGGNDPFGGGAGGEDPFGAGAGNDPFGAGMADDPFAPAGGADPFGGNPF